MLVWETLREKIQHLESVQSFLLVKYSLEFCLFYKPSKKEMRTYEVCNLFFEVLFLIWENLRIIRSALDHCTPQRCAIFSLLKFVKWCALWDMDRMPQCCRTGTLTCNAFCLASAASSAKVGGKFSIKVMCLVCFCSFTGFQIWITFISQFHCVSKL